MKKYLMMLVAAGGLLVSSCGQQATSDVSQVSSQMATDKNMQDLSLRCGTIRQGSKGHCVVDAQRRLGNFGYLAYQDIDGFFGPNTRKAVVRFQRDNGLAVDGIVGPKTWRALGR